MKQLPASFLRTQALACYAAGTRRQRAPLPPPTRHPTKRRLRQCAVYAAAALPPGTPPRPSTHTPLSPSRNASPPPHQPPRAQLPQRTTASWAPPTSVAASVSWRSVSDGASLRRVTSLSPPMASPLGSDEPHTSHVGEPPAPRRRTAPQAPQNSDDMSMGARSAKTR